MTYVVCQTSKCQQTYPLDEVREACNQLGYVEYGIQCPKCNGILVGKDGRANFSQNATVIPVMDMCEHNKYIKKKLKDKKKTLKQLKKEIKYLESENY